MLGHAAGHSADGALHFICMDWRHLHELLTAGRAVYGELKNLCVWVKDNGGMGSLYRSQHELVLVFKNGSAPHVNNVELGRHGRNRSNVWRYPGVNRCGAGRLEELRLHPTVKPVQLVADAILDCLQAARRRARPLSRQRHHAARRRAHRPAGLRAWSSSRATSTSRSAAGRSTPGGRLSMPRAASPSMTLPSTAPPRQPLWSRPLASRGRPGMPADYEVGYKKPPRHTRFRQGRSGNPDGRPKQARNLLTDLHEELQQRITVREGGTERRISRQRAVVMRLLDKALKGELGAVRQAARPGAAPRGGRR